MNKKKKILVFIRIFLIIIIIAMIPFVIYEGYKYKVQKDYQDSIPDITEAEMDEEVEEEIEEIEKEIETIKDDKTKETKKEEIQERKNYKKITDKNALRLIIPKLDLNTVVVNGTTLSALKHGPGLYSVAQMPGEGDRNTSIAGHRNGIGTTWNIFYDIDKINIGDEMFLAYQDKVYRYLYKETKIVNPDNIGVLDSQGYPCLTLTSCHPIGSNAQRIIIHAELKEIIERDETEY